MEAKTSPTASAPTNGGSIKNFDTFGNALQDAKRNHGSIAKAAAALPATESDPKTDKAIRKWARSKTTPTKLYKSLFSGKPLSDEQILRQSIDSTPLVYPQSVLGLIQARIKGAQTRITNRKSTIQDLRVTLRTGLIERKDKVVELTTAEKRSTQHKRLQAEAELIKAKDDLSLFRKNLREAMMKNGAPVRENIRSVREMSHIRRVAPSVSQQIIDYVESKTGVREQLITLKRDTPADDVPAGFLNIVKEGGEKTYNLLTSKPKLATQVRQRVMEYVTTNK